MTEKGAEMDEKKSAWGDLAGMTFHHVGVFNTALTPEQIYELCYGPRLTRWQRFIVWIQKLLGLRPKHD